MPLMLKELTAVQLHAALAEIGVQPRDARQLQGAAVRHGALPESLPNVSPRVLDEVRRRTTLPHLTLLDRQTSPQDGFTKYVFRGAGPEPFESVRIPLLHRPEDLKYIVCVSSQVGCGMGCQFCATGRLGFRRQLATWEIVDQVIKVQADSQLPVRGVVFMGMGEPLLNYEAVMQAARIMSEPCGLAIAGKAITISTVGIVPALRRFTAERHSYRLVISLTSADPDQRRALMPVEQAYPTSELMQALREYHAATGRRVVIAWTMMAGVNTREADAIQLAELTRGLPIVLNLIDVNDPTGRFRPPSPAELSAFRDALRTHLGMPVSRRYSGGQDIHAACGMLVADRHATSIQDSRAPAAEENSKSEARNPKQCPNE
jgi:23S rRNA (adenine2503-C2)-methyltransferase